MGKFGEKLDSSVRDYEDVIVRDVYIDYEKLKEMIYLTPDAFLPCFAEQIRKVSEHLDTLGTTEDMCSCVCGPLNVKVEQQQPLTAREVEALEAYKQVNREACRKILKKYDKERAKAAPDAIPVLESQLVLVDEMLRLTHGLDAVLTASHNAAMDKRLDWLPFAGNMHFCSRLCYLAGVLATVVGLFTIILAVAVQPTHSGTLLIVGSVGAFVMAWANGANDIANSVGTSVGAGVLTLRQALVIGCFAEALGAMTLGSFVSKTISKGLIEPDEYAEQPDLFALAMFACLWGAGLTTLLATAFGWPISATHSIIGGLVAAGLKAKGPGSISWGKLAKTGAGWVAAPIVGMLISFLLALLISILVHRAKDPAGRSRRLQPFFLAVTVGTCLLFLFIKGPKVMRIEPVEFGVLIAYASGAACSLLLLAARRLRAAAATDEPAAAASASAAAAKSAAGAEAGGGGGGPTSAPDAAPPSAPRPAEDGALKPTADHRRPSTVHLARQSPGTSPPGPQPADAPGPRPRQQVALPQVLYQLQGTSPEDGAKNGPSTEWHSPHGTPTAPAPAVVGVPVEAAPPLGLRIDVTASPPACAVPPIFSTTDEAGGGEFSPPPPQTADEAAEAQFRPLLVLSATCVAFAHGGNDVGNAVGPLAVLLQSHQDGTIDGTPDIPMWCLALGALGFVCGILTMGARTIATVGGKITALTPSRSFATQIGAAVAVLASSVLELPVSTSHCLIGSVVGVGIAQRCVGTGGAINWSVMKRIVLGWVVTIPVAMLVCYTVFAPLEHAFSSPTTIAAPAPGELSQ